MSAATSGAELVRRLREPGLVLVNVLPRAAFEEGRIPTSLSLPLDEIPGRAAEVLPDRDAEIIVYCGGGT